MAAYSVSERMPSTNFLNNWLHEFRTRCDVFTALNIYIMAFDSKQSRGGNQGGEHNIEMMTNWPRTCNGVYVEELTVTQLVNDFSVFKYSDGSVPCPTRPPEDLPLSQVLKLNSVASVRERTIPTERPPLVGEVSANFCGLEGATWSAWRILTAVFSTF
jgi:hypothetical protein